MAPRKSYRERRLRKLDPVSYVQTRSYTRSAPVSAVPAKRASKKKAPAQKAPVKKAPAKKAPVKESSLKRATPSPESDSNSDEDLEDALPRKPPAKKIHQRK